MDVLICGGIGGGAQNALAEAGIKLYGGVSGNADEAVNAYLEGKLDFNPNVQCSHICKTTVWYYNNIIKSQNNYPSKSKNRWKILYKM